jgi:hypothetical protein
MKRYAKRDHWIAARLSALVLCHFRAWLPREESWIFGAARESLIHLVIEHFSPAAHRGLRTNRRLRFEIAQIDAAKLALASRGAISAATSSHSCPGGRKARLDY